MRYDFSVMTDRRNTNSMKWDVEDSILPMWVADMDFRTAPEIIEAIEVKVRKGIFGYTTVPDDWYKSIGDWWERRHNFRIDRDWLIFCTGVVPAISSAVRKLTTVGENILVQTPVYNIFFNSILNNGRNVVENRLIYDDGEYSIDFKDLEDKLSDPQTTMMILCNPHNPIGKVWDREVLERIGELCHKYGVIVISDEIHCDLTEKGCGYIPFASVSGKCADISITCIAPTKAFNIAGLQTAAVVVPNAMLRHRMNRALNTDEVAEPNAIAMEATIAAFTEGEEWLDELNSYLAENRRFAADFMESLLPELHLVKAHSTYLLWVDVRSITMDTVRLCRYLREESGLYVSAGDAYGASGKGFIRINAACPRERLRDGLERLRKGIEKYNNF